MAKTKKKKTPNSTANLGFEQKLWLAADKLRGNMDAAEYKHVILGLIFLKYISDSFESRKAWLVREVSEPKSQYFVRSESQRLSVIEDKDEYTSENVFWVPPSARWAVFQKNAKQPTIGKIIDEAMDVIEKENRRLKGILPKNYSRPELDKVRLGELIDLIGTIDIGGKEGRSRDLLGRVYEYFLGKFAAAEGKSGGEFYTPNCIVRLLVEMIEPLHGRVYDPCCGSGGMFVQSEKFVEAHGGKRNVLAVYGQESNPTTWRLAAMNLAIRGIEANLGGQWADTFHHDLHPDLKADYILANPPFNISDWGGERLREDKRWDYGVPPVGNANFAWVQHMIHHLAPNGVSGFVLANVALSSDNSSECDIRQGIIEADFVDCVVSLPERLFYSTPIPVSLWFVTRNKNHPSMRDRRGETLFIEAGKLGNPVSRTLSVLTEDTINRISNTYHEWKRKDGKYVDVRGFCQSISKDAITDNGYSLLPAAYVGVDSGVKGITPNQFRKLVNGYTTNLEHNADHASSLFKQLNKHLSAMAKGNELKKPPTLKKWLLSEVVEPSNERLGSAEEPEILTCTERGGLIFQRERFAKRVATEDTSNYKIVRKTDIVYNPYLLWKGAIDQCWIVEMGITSPAYEVLKVKPNFDPSLIGFVMTAPWMIERYNGISVGTIQRRRRAPVERLLELEVLLPSLQDQAELSEVTIIAQELAEVVLSSKSVAKEFLQDICQYFLSKAETKS